MVAGGSMPTVVPQVIIENPNIDYVIEGEGEIAFKELLSALEKRSLVNKVPNLWYKDNGKVINTGITKYLNLDEVPKMRLEFWNDKTLSETL